MKIRKLLEVINPEAHYPVTFVWSISTDIDFTLALAQAVEAFFKENDIEDELTSKLEESIVGTLLDNDVYWHDEKYCFQLVEC